jgi:hypothetical protein
MFLRCLLNLKRPLHGDHVLEKSWWTGADWP